MSIKFTDNSDKVKEEFEDLVQLALSVVGEKAEGFAKEDCPVDTGRLRNSITYATKTDQGTPNTEEGEKAQPKDYKKHATPEKNAVYIGTNVEYAIYVEFRDKLKHLTGKAHFLRDAATTHSAQYKDIVEKTLKYG